MRIAVITGEFPKVSETFVLNHINGILQLGHEVDIYAEYRPRGSDYARDDALAASMERRTTYIDMPSLRNGKRLLTAPQRIASCGRATPRLALSSLNPARFGRHAFDLSQLNRLYTLARLDHSQRYDVVHVHFGMVGDRFRFVKELWGAPLVVSFHGFDVTGWPKTQGRNCYIPLFEAASAFVVNSEHLRRRALALGCPPHKIVKIPEKWDMKNFPYTVHQREEGQPLRVLTVARLVEKKGVEDAIAAIALVRQTHPDVHYDIVGDGPLRSQIEALIDHLDLHETVALHGAQSSEYVRHMMNDAHVFLLPSVTSRTGDEEGLPVVLLEAQGAGLPVVSTLHAGIPEEVVHGETGFLAPEHAPEQLAHWLMYLADNSQAAADMGGAGRKHMERNFASERIDASFVDMYERVIAGAELSPQSVANSH